MTENGQWADALAATVAKEVSRLRKLKTPKWSIQRLADETAKLGYPIGQSVLSNFEYGRRGARLDVAELLVIAAALDVPPAHLLWPNYPDGPVEYLPNFPATAEVAGLIFTGRMAADFTRDADVPIGGRLPEVDELLEERLRLTDSLGALSLAGDMTALTKEIERITKRREEINKRLQQLGHVVTGHEDGSR